MPFTMAIDMPLVSIVIPTKNSSKKLRRCIMSLQKQTYPNIEVLVIDSFSTDDTATIATSLGVRVNQIMGERTQAKNFGTKIANGKYIIYIDSDMILEPCVLQECVTECEVNHRRGAVVPERSIGRSFWVKVRNFERTLYADTIIESPRFFWKDDVAKFGGFDEDVVIYEEATLPFKLEKAGLNIRFRISASIEHDEEGFDLVNWLSKKRYYVATQNLYEKRYEEYSKYQLSLSFRVKTYLHHWKKLLKNPLLSTGLATLKILEYTWSRKGNFEKTKIQE